MFFLGLITSTALYGIISLLVSLIGFRIDFSTLYNAAFHASNLLEYFYAFMFWSPAAYIVLIPIHFVLAKILGLQDGGFGTCLKEYGGQMLADFTNPWRGLVALIGAGETIDTFDWYGFYCWIEVILHFVWSLGLFGFIGYGFYCIVKGG